MGAEMNYRLYHGDCLNIMPTLKPGSVDLILCDPPYGTIKGADINGWDKSTTAWDIAIEPVALFNACERILRFNGKLILFSQEPYTSRLITQAPNCLRFNYRMIWKKENFGNPFIAKNAPVSYYEDVLVLTKKEDIEHLKPLRDYARKIKAFANVNKTRLQKVRKDCRLNHFMTCDSFQFALPTREVYNWLTEAYHLNTMPGFLTYDEMLTIKQNHIAPESIFNLPPGKRHKSNILEYARDRERYHPTQKPCALLADLIQTYSNPGDTVLDFTMGSGSTGVACLNTGRRFIGIEKDKKYFDIAAARIEESGQVAA